MLTMRQIPTNPGNFRRFRVSAVTLATFVASASVLAVPSAGKRTAPTRSAFDGKGVAALLVGSTFDAKVDPSEANDVSEMRALLIRSKVPERDIDARLAGAITAAQVRQEVARFADRAKARGVGTIFLYWSGHGSFEPSTERPGMYKLGVRLGLPEDQFVSWEEIFKVVDYDPSIHIFLLPDTCHTNMIDGQLPPNVASIVYDLPRDFLLCYAQTKHIHGTDRGVLSFYATATLKPGMSMEQWVAAMRKMADTNKASLPNLPKLKTSGANVRLPVL